MATAKSKIEIVNITLELSHDEALAIYEAFQDEVSKRSLDKNEISVYEALKEILM